jgi:protein SCO1/2
MYSKHFIWLFVALIVGVPLIVFTGVKWYENKYQQLPMLGGPEHRIGDFNLVNANNQKITIDDWNDKIVVADFFFTHCGTVCPKMTKNMKKVQDAFPADEQLVLNSFSIDPERDNPARLTSYASKYNIDQRNWNLITGDKREIYRLARKSFLVTATDGDGGDDDFIHSEQFVLIDKQKKIRGFYTGTDDEAVSQLISDIRKLKNE